MNPIKTLLKNLCIFTIITNITTTYAETDNGTTYAGGEGTKEDPYKIATLEQLRKLSETTSDWDKYFIQTADIDASDTKNWNIGDHDSNPDTPDLPMGFSPIGDNIEDGSRQQVTFTGDYNGQGYSIDQLYINRPEENYVGLFGHTYPSDSIQHLAVTNANITGKLFTGILAGGTIYTRVANCYTTGIVTGIHYTGGLVGKCGHARNCYSQATVNCQSNEKGGLGTFYWSANETYHQNNFYNSDIYTESNEYGYGMPLTTDQMKQQASFVNWDFVGETLNGCTDIWAISPAENNGYPYFTRDRQDIVLNILPAQTNFTTNSQAFPLENITGIPATATPIISYRQSAQTPAAGWSTIAPANAGIYDIKVSVSASESYIAKELIAEGAWIINKITPDITFPVLDTKTYGDAVFELTASTTGDGNISYTLDNKNVATINGNSVTIVGAGTTDITASTTETSNYLATSTFQTLTVNKANGNISWEINNTTINVNTSDEPFFLCSAISTIPDANISYHSDNAGIAIVDATTRQVTINSAGSCTITATAEAMHYLPAEAMVYLEVSSATTINSFDQNKTGFYPNPATNIIYIKGAERKKIAIYSLSGQKIMEKQNTSKINISKLKRGVYILKIGNNYSRKIILK